MNKPISLALLALAFAMASNHASASPTSTTTASCGQAGGTCSEDFTGKTANLQWTTLGSNNGSSSQNACLTAGTNSAGSQYIQGCPSSLAGYAIPADEKISGQGALLLTPAVNNQTGAILSAFTPFPMSQGINITFTTYTFRGDSGGTAKNGADGIVFILSDGTQAAPTSTGGEGGSMGYDCSNGNSVSDGFAYGYLGLGIDEFGNFLNSGDNGSMGVWNSNLSTLPGTTTQGSNPGVCVNSAGTAAACSTSNTGNTYINGSSSIAAGSGKQYQPERIGLRGAGNTNWAWLTANGDPTYYTGSSNSGYVQNACKSGTYVSSHTTSTSHGNTTTTWNYSSIPYNYNPLIGGSAILPNNDPIANESSSATRNPTSSTATANIAWPITYQLRISSSGLLSFAYSYNGGAMTPVLTNFNVTSANGPLPSSLRFGFSAGTGGDNNTHEITCFKASPLTSTSSAAANTIQSGQYKTGTQIYLASYSSNPWWGSLKAIPLVVTGSGASATLAASNTATWDGKCTLTSGWCDSMGTNSNGNPVYSVTAAATGATTTSATTGFVKPENRVLVTATNNDVTTSGSGVGFSMQTALTNYPTAVQSALSAGATTDSTPNSTPPITMTGQNLLGWLLGQRCNEQLFSTTQSGNGPWDYAGDCTNTTATGNLNPRTYVLGDIIDSSPTWVGAPVPGQYNDTFVDGLYGSTVTPPENQGGAQTYSAFATNYATRLNVAYVGSNDGYLHGFEAGYFNTSSSNTTCGTSTVNSSFSDPCATGTGGNDGKEVLGYMPFNVLLNQAANLTNPLGMHQYMVDATPGVGDLFYNSAWHTWLVGGVGTNGKEIYALDVTNPTNFTTAKAGALVIGDWTTATLPNLGNSVGTPQVARMHNGQWAIIFGNGLNSGGHAGVYIGLVNSSTGAVTFLFLDTGVGSSTVSNGIAFVTPADLDGDGIVDYLYAGDKQGNVWRFDVTGKSSTSWSVSNYPGSTASTCSNSSYVNATTGAVNTSVCSPLFTATTISGTTTSPQPITTAIATATVQTNGVSRNMLYFGTGMQTPQTGNSSTQYAPQSTGSTATTQQQTFYGIWDWNMAGWNAVSTATQQLASNTGSVSISTSNLQQVTSTTTTVTGQTQITGYRTLSAATTICWAGSSTCSPASNNTQYGWYYNLPVTNEQIIYNPNIINGAVVVNTAIPPTVSATQCTAATQTGWTMAFDATSGGALVNNFFSSFNSAASGVQANAVGTPTAVTYNGQVYLVSQTVTGGAFVQRVTPPNDNSPGRVSWREIRN